ncbi:MAG: pitrilysin family protein [Patescibacteria group bacterium]|nr:insulinase family protein [Patescibacteria group bacterium]
MHKTKTLDNGLRVVAKKLEGTQAVTVLILCGAGSRYEEQGNRGISHFLEHMFFKGAKKYGNAKAVSEAIDGIGGESNAFTGKEYAGYYVKVASPHLETAADVLSDMLLNAKFDSADIERERGVILEEYNMYQDTPMYQIGWDFEHLVFGDQPMGWDQIGTKKLIREVTHDDFVKYKGELYTADNCVVAVVGNIDADEAFSLIEGKFKFGAEKKGRIFEPFTEGLSDRAENLHKKKTEQAHLVCGAQGISENDDDHFAMQVLSVVLGGGMSSRMFQSVREEKGLCYYVRTNTDDYTDCGIISTSAGVDIKRVDEALAAIKEEYAGVREKDVPKAELQKAKEYMKGKIVLRLEDSEEMAHLLSKYYLLYGEVRTAEEVIKAIDAVKAEDLRRVAKELLAEDRLKTAVIGPC